MAVNVMPEQFRYVAINLLDSSEHIFTDKTKGWDEITTALIRGVFHGINSEQTAPISFAYDARDFFRDIFLTYGAFAKVNLRIDKRNEDWTYTEYTTFVCDFKTFKDDCDYVTLELKENSLRELISSKMDTEYDVEVVGDLPQDGWDVTLINQLPFLSSNTVQSKSGTPININYYHESGIAYYKSQIRGQRTDNRFLSTHFIFTYSNLVPFDFCGFQCTVDITQKIKFRLKLHLILYAYIAPYTLIRLIRLRGSDEYVLSEYLPTSFTKDESYRPFKFDVVFDRPEIEIEYDFKAGDLVFLQIYQSESDGEISYEGNEITDSQDTYIKIVDEINSDFSLRGTYFFTHKKALQKVLHEISPNAVLDYKLSYANYIPALISNRTILDQLQDPFVGFSKVRLKLKDILESLDYLYDIGVDIDGNTITIDYVQNMYKNTKSMDLVCNQVEISYNDKFCYNNVVVGTDTSKDLNVTYGIYSPFTEKTFTIAENVISADDNKLEIKHPYKIDQYSIDKWWTDLLNNEKKVKDDTSTEIAMVALELNPVDGYYFPIRAEYITPEFTLTQRAEDYYNIPFTPKRLLINKMKSLTPLFFGIGNDTLKWTSNKVQLANGFISKMDYEDANIEEDTDLDFSTTDKIHLPLSCNISTSIDANDLLSIKNNKYEYVMLTDKKGNSYKCYISKLISKIGKTSSNNCELIIKEL